jgi:hypothetical protein
LRKIYNASDSVGNKNEVSTWLSLLTLVGN